MGADDVGDALVPGLSQHPIASPIAARAIASEASTGHRGERGTALRGQGGWAGVGADGFGGTLDTVLDATAEPELR